MSVEDKEQVEQLEENGSAEGEASETDWQAEAQKNQDLFLRAKAEMDNLRKRLEREKADFLKYANEALIKDLLPLLDNLDRALVQARACDIKDEGLVEGVRLTQEGVMSVLEKFGVSRVAALGEPFDPNFHEAVMQREDPDVEANTVVEEIQKGYLLHDRLIRPSMVIVSRRPGGDD